MLLEAFKRGLKLIPSRLFGFIKKLLPCLWFYTYTSAIPILIALVIMGLVKLATGSVVAATLTFNILATIGQIVPLASSLYISEHELIDTDEDSAEICFIICALVIAALWL